MSIGECRSYQQGDQPPGPAENRRRICVSIRPCCRFVSAGQKLGGSSVPASLSETADGHCRHLPWGNLDLVILCVPGQDLLMNQIILGFVCAEDRKFPFEQCLLGRANC